MKVADIIKITDDATQVLIRNKFEYTDCLLGRDPDKCPSIGFDEEYETEDCRSCTAFTQETGIDELYYGSAQNVPIKIADKKIVEICISDREVPISSRSKKTIRSASLAITIKD